MYHFVYRRANHAGAAGQPSLGSLDEFYPARLLSRAHNF